MDKRTRGFFYLFIFFWVCSVTYVADGTDETLRVPTFVAAGALGENGHLTGLHGQLALLAQPHLVGALDDHRHVMVLVLVISLRRQFPLLVDGVAVAVAVVDGRRIIKIQIGGDETTRKSLAVGLWSQRNWKSRRRMDRRSRRGSRRGNRMC